MSTSLSGCIFCALLAKTKSIRLAVPPLLERKKRTAPGCFWSTRGITASEHKKAQSEHKGSRTIYLSSHTEHISVGTRTCFLRTESFIYATVCRKKPHHPSHNNLWISFSSTAVRRLQIKALSFSLYYQL